MTNLDPNPDPNLSDEPADTTPQPDPVPAPADDGKTALGGDPDPAPADDGKKTEDAPAAPEKYELKAPEGQDFDAEAFGAVEPVLRELNLPNEAAQKLVDAYAGQVLPVLQQRADAAIAQRAADQSKEWNDAFTADPEIGGAKKEETLTFAAKAFDHYGLKKGEGLRQLLDESGLGNHPDVIRFVSKVGRDLGEAGFERGSPTPTSLSDAETFYGAGYGKKQAEQRS